MNKKTVLILSGFLFFIQSALFGQSPDSITFVHKTWKIKPVKKGVIWKQAHFDKLFESQQEINLVEIDLKKYRKKIRIAADSVTLKKTTQFASENNALVAINGGFFDMKNGGSVDYIKVNKKIINKTKEKTDRANAILMIDKKSIEIQLASAVDYEGSKAPNIFLSGPLLIHQGLETMLADNPFNKNRHPRSAIAITTDQKLLLIVVDGRNSLAAGMDLTELANTLRWLGAQDAMNLDGGGSSTLYVNSTKENAVVNHPSDNKLFDHEGQRPVANIIYLKQ